MVIVASIAVVSKSLLIISKPHIIYSQPSVRAKRHRAERINPKREDGHSQRRAPLADLCRHAPPRPLCSGCSSRDVGVFAASGKGRRYSYVIHHRPVTGFNPSYATGVVELDEGPRVMTNITQCPKTPEALQLDMPVEVAFERPDGQITLPLFRPARR